MASARLVFTQPRHTGGNPVPLVFGAGGQAEVPSYAITARGRITIGLRGVVEVGWSSNVSRPLVNDTTTTFGHALSTTGSVRTSWQESENHLSGTRVDGRDAKLLLTSHSTTWQEAETLRNRIASTFERAESVQTAQILVRYQESVSVRSAIQQWFQEAERLTVTTLRSRYQDAHRDRRNFTAGGFQKATPYFAAWVEYEGPAASTTHGWVSRYEQAVKPSVGIWVPPKPKPADPCYTPVLPANLVFIDRWTGSANLIFVCKRCDPTPPEPEPGDTVVVPVREVYLTINSAVLVRVDNGHYIPATAMAMSVNVESWTWAFSASIPGAALDQVKPNSNGDPVVVQATINGTPYRFVIEKVGRDRSFNSSQLRVTGRGLAAELDAPYAAQMSFSNTQPRNARQLLDDILLVNNVPIGWDIGSFGLDDWAVPAGVFSHVGTHISAINAVVKAAGGYVQPHNTDRTLEVLAKYPYPSWDWTAVTPQYELPASVTSQEGFDWADKPKYNRVFVSGQEGGVLGQYTRSGTAGDLVAPTVVDPLITEAVAARQLGRSIISDSGRIATVTLRLPVLAETGIIKPGNFVHYKEGSNTHVGITRGVSVAVGLPTIYQTLTVETHVEPV